jgi:hypothetical protein
MEESIVKKEFNLGQAIQFSFQSLRKYPLFIMAPVALQTAAMIMFSAGNDMYSKLSHAKSPQDFTQPGFILLMFFGFLVMLVIYFLVLTITQISIIRIGFKLFQGEEEPAWKDVSKLDWLLIGKYLSCLLLLGFYMLLALLVCFIPGVIVYFVAIKLINTLRILLVTICMIPFLALVVYIFINYYFVTPIAVDTRDTVNRIFQKSRNLTKGIKWNILGYLFLMFIVSYPITRYIMTFKKLGYGLLYYFLYGIFTFLWTSLLAMIPIYLYKDLVKQQTDYEMTNKLDPIEENLEEEQAEELVEESPEL